jgi:hypothetical protein
MRRIAFLCIVLGTVCSLFGATNPIGMAFSGGAFRVNNSRVQGNSTLFDGTMIETESALSELHLKTGVQVELGAETRATVYQRKLVLEYGQLESVAAYDVEARSLHIVGVTPDALVRIQVRNQRNVQVAAVRGPVRVSNAAGVLVASIEAGKSMSFEPQNAPAGTATHASGCLLSKNGKLVVAEQTTNVILELRGTGLEKELGNRVEVNGTAVAGAPAVAGASQIVNVAGIRRIAAGGCMALARKIGAAIPAAATAAGAAGSAGAAGGAAAGAGIGAGTVAVIGGVAAAAAVGSLAVVGALPGQSNSSTVSR